MTMPVVDAERPAPWRWQLAVALVALAGLVALSVSYIYGKGLNGPPIRADGFGYHAYLPALLIHHDATFVAFAQSFPDGALPQGSGIRWVEDYGAFLNQYPIGTALLAAPFFLMADLYVVITGGERSGLSQPYQVANMVAGSTYLIFGTLIVWRILAGFFAASVAAWTLVVVIFGTNVFHYASYDASFSHIYSWFLVAAYLLALIRYHEGPGRRALPFLAGVLLGLIVITRVPNGVVGVLALAAWLDARRAEVTRRRSLGDLATFAVGLGIALLPLFLYWSAATGSLIVYSYGAQGFAWHDPALTAFLFSVSKGLLFWAPLLFLAIPGFFVLPARLRPWFSVSAPIAVVLQIYLCASWRPWDFGGSFGSRPFVEFMPILALPIAATLAALRPGRLRVAVRVLVVLLVGLNLFLMHAYWRRFIPFSGTTVAVLADLPRKHLLLLGFPGAAEDRSGERARKRGKRPGGEAGRERPAPPEVSREP